ncbi:MAG TPA: thymidine kinase [Tenericutes bacterium]|nr:thymidine kinase [Mycoplasmatota bacterium]
MSSNKKGHIEIICGCMFAGKTEELLRRLRRLDYAKTKYLVFKPKIDNRYDSEKIVSHNGTNVNSYSVSSAKEILNYLTCDVEVVAIDEAQFFDKNLVPIVDFLADLGIRVILTGLDKDFRGEPFGIMPELLSHAEKVDKLTAICAVCGDEATRTQRLINGKPASYYDEIILVGALEAYEARCRRCHQVLDKPINKEIKTYKNELEKKLEHDII